MERHWKSAILGMCTSVVVIAVVAIVAAIAAPAQELATSRICTAQQALAKRHCKAERPPLQRALYPDLEVHRSFHKVQPSIKFKVLWRCCALANSSRHLLPRRWQRPYLLCLGSCMTVGYPLNTPGWQVLSSSTCETAVAVQLCMRLREASYIVRILKAVSAAVLCLGSEGFTHTLTQDSHLGGVLVPAGMLSMRSKGTHKLQPGHKRRCHHFRCCWQLRLHWPGSHCRPATPRGLQHSCHQMTPDCRYYLHSKTCSF